MILDATENAGVEGTTVCVVLPFLHGQACQPSFDVMPDDTAKLCCLWGAYRWFGSISEHLSFYVLCNRLS